MVAVVAGSRCRPPSRAPVRSGVPPLGCAAVARPVPMVKPRANPAAGVRGSGGCGARPGRTLIVVGRAREVPAWWPVLAASRAAACERGARVALVPGGLHVPAAAAPAPLSPRRCPLPILGTQRPVGSFLQTLYG
jgi:hypothetical protein